MYLADTLTRAPKPREYTSDKSQPNEEHVNPELHNTRKFVKRQVRRSNVISSKKDGLITKETVLYQQNRSGLSKVICRRRQVYFYGLNR